MKTKLGISAGLLGAALCFIGLFSGYLAIIVIGGYIMLFENSVWLKKLTVKTFAFMLAVSIASTVIAFIPNIITLINNLCGIFGGYFSLSPVSSFVSFLQSVLSIVEKVVLLLMGVAAIKEGSFPLGPIDALADKAVSDNTGNTEA